MKFGYTIIYVPDVIKTIAFYETAFGMKRKFIDETKTYAELESGATTLSFAEDEFAHKLTGVDHRNNNPHDDAAGFEIALITENVGEAFKKAVQAGAVSLKEPEAKPWGQTVAYVRDLNGILVEIAEPVED